MTLSQNYRRLGLTSKLNSSTGGTEKSSSNLKLSQDALAIASLAPKSLIPSTVRVERDPSTGAILRVIRHEEPADRNPLNDPLKDLSDDETMTGKSGPQFVSTDVVHELEKQAKMEVKKRPRQQSQIEEEWIEKLVKRWGDDYVGMARDRKSNPMQQSEGDLRRRVKRWRDRGGGK